MKDYSLCTYHEINMVLLNACQSGELHIVAHVLSSPALPRHAHIGFHMDRPLMWACEHGHLEVVRYLLTSPELTEHADIHANDDEALSTAGQQGHLHIVKYLLMSPELTEHADMHANDGQALRLSYTYGHMDVVNYLLYDMNFQWKPESRPTYGGIKHMMKKRDLFFMLNHEIKQSQGMVSDKPKI